MILIISLWLIKRNSQENARIWKFDKYLKNQNLGIGKWEETKTNWHFNKNVDNGANGVKLTWNNIIIKAGSWNSFF